MTDPSQDHAWAVAQFTRADGSFRFARWARPLAPVIVGTDDAGCRIFEDGIRAVAGIAGLETGGLDPDLGANFLVFLVNDWAELTEAPNLGRLIPDLDALIDTLGTHGANQYRVFGFEETGGIRLCITLLRYDDELQRVSAQTLGIGQALQGMLLWSDTAFAGESPIAITEGGICVVKPRYAALLRAAYDPALPVTASDPAFAYRLVARMISADASAG